MFKRLSAVTALSLALLGCDIGTEPSNVLVSVYETYLEAPEGCGVNFTAEAIGTSRATWGDVVLSYNDQVLDTYTGPEFWGTDGITPGEDELTSIDLALEDREQPYILSMTFVTGERMHEFVFGLQCPPEE